jgi:PPOX class probable F420-dependent enzyme
LSFLEAERSYVREARVGRLATVDADGRPHAVPICFAPRGGAIVSAVDEKPKYTTPDELRRLRDLRANPRVALVVDHYTEHWSELGRVQARGTASLLSADDDGYADAVQPLRAKYDQ